MHFTTTLITLFLGLEAAAPSSLSDRQARIVYVQLHAAGGCEAPWVEDVVFNQAVSGCVNTGITQPHQSAQFLDSSTSCTLRVYNQPGCNEDTSNWIDVPAGFSGCRALNVQSAKFIC